MSKTPKLRFKEFSGDWESKKLGDLGDVTKLAGFEFTNHVEYSDTGEIIALRGLNVKNGKLILDDVKYIDNSDFSKLNRSKLFIDDLLFTYVGTVGETALIDKNDKYYLAPNVSRIRFDLNESNSKFMHYNISRSEYFNKVIQPSIATSSQPALSMENIRKLNINIPSKEEQEKIASFFSLIDDKISLQGEKMKMLKDYKTGMMQKIFSRELRFKDDEDRDYPQWEEKKFKDFTKINQGLQIPISERYTTEGENRYFYITNEFLKSDSETKYYIENPSESVICYEDDILMTRTGNTGKVVTGVKGAFHNNFFKIAYDKEKYDRMFLYYILTSHKMQKNIIRLAGSSTIPDLNHSDFYNIKVKLPIIEEQKKIADLLIRLDSKISKEQEKLDSLNEYKKGLLQQMFV